MQVPFGVAFGNAEHFGYLLVRVSFQGKQVEYRSRRKGQLPKHLQQVVSYQFFVWQRLARYFAGAFHGFLVAKTVVGSHIVHGGIHDDAFHPGGEVALRAKLIDACQDFKKRLVQDIRGIAPIAGIAQAQAHVRLIAEPVQLLLCRAIFSQATIKYVFGYDQHTPVKESI